jgi:hypothetical protein
VPIGWKVVSRPTPPHPGVAGPQNRLARQTGQGYKTPVPVEPLRRGFAFRLAVGLMTAGAPLVVSARDSGDPIQLTWIEGDVAGMTSIFSGDGKTMIGFVEYHQHRHGDVLEAVRVAHFKDGSSDEDQVEARIGKTLEALSGRTIIRNKQGKATVDLKIDVVGGRVTGSSGLGKERQTYDEKMDLSAGTYWGPLVFIVVKNFDQNVTDGRVVFRTVVPTPKPRVLDMELRRGDGTAVPRPGGSLKVVRFTLRPTINWLVDPIVRMIAPETQFLVQPGTPPSLARFQGPRNYTGQKIRIE